MNFTPTLADGNRLQKGLLAGEALETDAYQYYPESDLLMIAGSTAYVYDENGNLIGKGSNYTGSGQTLMINYSEDYRAYSYDLLNRLVKVEGYGTGTTDGSDGTNETEAIYFYGTDHLGSTVLITDEDGVEVWSGESNPFGDNVTGEGTLTDQRVIYTGKDYDEDIGLYYFNARWYDPEVGRFITEASARDGNSWYAYVGNNPIIHVDPTGLEGILESEYDGYMGLGNGNGYLEKFREGYESQVYDRIEQLRPDCGDLMGQAIQNLEERFVLQLPESTIDADAELSNETKKR